MSRAHAGLMGPADWIHQCPMPIGIRIYAEMGPILQSERLHKFYKGIYTNGFGDDGYISGGGDLK